MFPDGYIIIMISVVRSVYAWPHSTVKATLPLAGRSTSIRLQDAI